MAAMNGYERPTERQHAIEAHQELVGATLLLEVASIVLGSYWLLSGDIYGLLVIVVGYALTTTVYWKTIRPERERLKREGAL